MAHFRSSLASARLLSRGVVLFALLALALTAAQPAKPPPRKPSFKVAWSIYVGWMPWDYAGQSGILKKWADKYGIKIELTQINDYVESINQYTAGQYDACVMTNMDTLTIPAAGGVDSTALIVGDYSNGNDGIVLKGTGKKLADIKGQSVNLVELSVSHYLLARGARYRRPRGEGHQGGEHFRCGHGRRRSRRPRVTSVVTWKPLLSEITAVPKTTLVFDSSKTPGEILDLMIVNSEVLKANPETRQGAGRRLVRDAGADAGQGREGHGRARVDGQGLGHGPRGLQGAARDHLHVLDAGQPRWPRPRAPISSRRWTWCASSPSTMGCSAKAPRPSTWSASRSRAARRSATRPTSRCASTRPT